jgi:hypothetical protein
MLIILSFFYYRNIQTSGARTGLGLLAGELPHILSRSVKANIRRTSYSRSGSWRRSTSASGAIQQQEHGRV